MQGPVDETVYDIQSNMVLSRVDKGFNRHSKSQKVHMRAESGTCNVCSAPCSSCLHINQAFMGSKTEESSDETSPENTCSYSVNDVLPTVKSRTCEIGQHATGKTSNLVSMNSSHDSVSENAESQVNLRPSDVTGASEDVEIFHKSSSGGTVEENQHTLKPQCDSGQRNLVNKSEDPRGLEGHDDNISCVSRANEANKLSGSDIGNIDRNMPFCSASGNSLVSEGYGKTVSFQTSAGGLDIKCDIERSQTNSGRQSRYEEPIQKVFPPIGLSTELSPHNSGLMENPSSKETDDGAGSRDIHSTHSHLPSGKSLPCDPSSRNFEEDSCFRLQGELHDFSRENLNPLITKEVVSDIGCGQKSSSYNCDAIQNRKVGLIGDNSEASVKICEKLEVATDSDAGDLLAEALNSVEQYQEVEKVKGSFVLSVAKEISLLSHPVDGSDESDIVEHDVKVCDICGDAGREDLLAICCRCSDGAEHTYCMREMLDKLPEGDWLCEECKFDEEIKNQKQDEFGTVDVVENNQFFGQAGTENANLRVKSDIKGSDIEGNRTNKECSSTKVFGKRFADDLEVPLAAKKQALDPIMGSPKTSSPSRIGALSRNSSFKNLERGKVKPVHQFPPGNHSVNDTLETACSPSTGRLPQTPGGAFIKSNSFNSSNPKPKVKLVDEVVPQKQKLTREPASLDTKEGAVRVIGRSMSFKSANSGRLNACESKVKMLSPKFSHVQNLKGLKHAKDRNFFERKSSFKSERPLINSTMASSTVLTPRADKKLASHGETVSPSSTSNNRELKYVQSDSKSIALSKPANHVARRGSEMPVPLGEIRRQLSNLPSVVGASSANGVSNSLEQKPIQASVKDDSLPNSFTAERSLVNVNGSLPDGLPMPQESTNLAERIKESSISRPRQTITVGARGVPCQKCNEIGHSAQFCTVDGPRSQSQSQSRSLAIERSLSELMNQGNKLKSAIEAAMLKKPGIYRKNRFPNQPDELSVSSMNFEVTSQDQLSSNTRNMISAEEVNEGEAIPRNSNSDSSKQTTGNNVKQFMVVPAEAVTSRRGDACSIFPSDGKPFMMDLPSHASVAMSARLKMSAIPDHECIWQGSFEVQRGGKIPDLCDGFQAHLSTCASPRVLEVVNKFPSKVLLNEVPRLSTWPVKFKESGVKEDNIGLYFFAKDLESYEKSYKILLESMMRSDLALKGNIDGVELLIFPSNQLPEKSQHWNMLFFLWGVFRGKRVTCLQQVPGSPKKFGIPRYIPTMFLPENICSFGSIDKDTHDKTSDTASEAPALLDLPGLSSTETINGDCDAKVSPLVTKGKCAQINMERLDCRPDSNSLSTMQTSSVQSSTEMRCTNTSLEGHVDFDCKLDAEFQASVQATRTVDGFNRSGKMLIHWDSLLDRPQASSHYVNIVPAGHVQGVASVESLGKDSVLDRVNSSIDQVEFRRNLKAEGSLDAEASPERETMMRVSTTKELNSCHFSHRKRPCVDPTETLSHAASAGTSQTGMLVDGVGANKKQKTGFSGLYECNDCTSSSRDGFASRMHDVEKQCDETAIIENLGNAERYFFPVDPGPVKDIGLGDDSTPWIGFSSDNEDRPPNLELALGAETKPAKKVFPPFLVGKAVEKINQDQQPHDEEAMTEDGDDVSASLSLSLSFPFPFPEDKDRNRAVQSVTKAEQLLPEKRRVSPSLLLFGGFSEK